MATTGATVGKYTVIKTVGSGSFGKAYLVEDPNRNKSVMKVVDISRMKPADRALAETEIEVLAKITAAPFVITYREKFSSMIGRKLFLCIVTDFYSGGDLSKLIAVRRAEKRPFSEKSLRTWLVQLALGLEYMHAKNILHRDLKPSNVFLDKNNCAFIGDVGMARVLDFTLQQAHTFCGTPAYMAPELCKDSPYQKPADIWALGCIMFELASFTLPFTGISSNDLYGHIVRGQTPKWPTHYSTEIRGLCEKMLEKNHRQRPTVEHILHSSWLQEEVLHERSRFT